MYMLNDIEGKVAYPVTTTGYILHKENVNTITTAEGSNTWFHVICASFHNLSFLIVENIILQKLYLEGALSLFLFFYTHKHTHTHTHTHTPVSYTHLTLPTNAEV